MAKYMEPGTTQNAVSLHISRNLLKDAKALRDTVAAGGDPMSIALYGSKGTCAVFVAFVCTFDFWLLHYTM